MTKSISTPATKTAADLLTDQELAAELAIEPRTLRLWRNTRALPHLRITPRVIRYRRGDIDAWLARRSVSIAS